MVLVACRGGASRAGYWTAAAPAQLQTAAAKLTGKDGKRVDFGAHVFAISSVSGGSVGAVGYSAMLKTAGVAKCSSRAIVRIAALLWGEKHVEMMLIADTARPRGSPKSRLRQARRLDRFSAGMGPSARDLTTGSWSPT
jgi:hypothetical protein